VRLKNPEQVAAFLREELATCRARLNDYAHQFSPKKFTQPQLMALLKLRDYCRGLKALRRRARSKRDSTTRAKMDAAITSFEQFLGLSEVGTLGYRRLTKLLADNPELRVALELKRIPDHSTLARAEKRFAMHAQE
jgi:hypothetical protein